MVSILIDKDTLLRTYQVEDADELFRVVSESRPHLRTWLAWVDKTTKAEHSLHFIQQSLQQQHNQEGLALGIFYKNSIVGSVGMHQWDHALKKAQLGYWISKPHERKGIIVACMKRFIDFLFERTDLNKLEIHYALGNARSSKISDGLGFKVEGVLRQSMLHNGMLEDLVVTGLLKGEWTSARPYPKEREM